ncbi:MAG: hypothetical protein IPJ35_09785 [Elusimicrobia bacterium]|nr:hypothetical protein [Elusimicrobiota bacterium]
MENWKGRGSLFPECTREFGHVFPAETDIDTRVRRRAKQDVPNPAFHGSVRQGAHLLGVSHLLRSCLQRGPGENAMA